MESADFIRAVEEYYEKRYEVNMEIKAIVDFLNANIPPERVGVFFQKLTDHHSKKWKSLPDKSIMAEVLEKHRDGWVEIRAENIWRLLLAKSAAHDILISDPVAHYVVAGYGSWDEFCRQRDGAYRELTHKDFVKRYVQAAKAEVGVTPKPLAGHYRLEYGPNFVGLETQIVGDQEKGRALLDAKEKAAEVEHLTGFVKEVS